MNTRPVRVVVIGVVAGLLLGGCGADRPSPDTSSSADSSTTASPDAADGSPAPGRATSTPRRKKGQAKGGDGSTAPSPAAPSAADGDDATTDSADDGDTGDAGDTADTGDTGDTGDGSAPALEMPEAPAPTVSSLSQLLPPSNPAPLVTAPLPRAASAQGRLLASFPDALRPTRAARVQSSSVSPSGDRLQVGLVATTSLSPARLLLAYRTRLSRRGMAETATPPSVAGSRAAAFRRGDSVVTVTVTPRGSGTSYAVHASLRADQE